MTARADIEAITNRIRERYVPWAESGITGLTINTSQPAAIELMAEVAAANPAVARA